MRYASPHQPLLLGYQSSNVLGRHKPDLFLRSRKLRTVLAARSSSSSSSSSTTRKEKLLGDKIREQLLNAAPSPPSSSSSYDTAWVAMVPAPGSPLASRFPQCVDWILQNQRGDGSWGSVCSDHPSLGKDTLSSTLACVLALRTWGVGDEHVSKGLRFIGHNSSFVTDDKCDTPAGFNVIFPGMLTRCLCMGLEIPLTPAEVDAILRLRDMELKSLASRSKAFMAYVAEGLGNLLDWDQAMEYQRNNGSFFNSPATTAAVSMNNYNGRAIEYLDSLIRKFGSSVPTLYPGNMYSRLCTVDTLEKMGVSPSFSNEINNILDMIYSSWLANDEEICLDMTTCAMAFRLLRLHGYGIPSDGLAQFSEESSFHDSVQGYLNDTEALLELYKASQVQIFEEELILENIGSWSTKLLKQQLWSNKISRSIDPAEVEHALKFPFYVTLDRLEHRRNIEHFKPGGFQMLKSAYRWDAHEEAGFCSERVEILFRAVYKTSNDIGAKAAAVQKRSVIGHIAELWAEMVRAMMSEAEWRMSGHVPSMEEYMEVGLPSFALGPILPSSTYLVGPELTDDMVRGHEYAELLRHTNICGRLQNDYATYEREKAQGKINSVLLLAPRHGGCIEAAKREVKSAIEASRRELLRLVTREEGAVPRPCRSLFWDVCKVVHRFYMGEDGYTSPTELMHAGNAVVLDPLRLPAGKIESSDCSNVVSSLKV
ncbi:Stemar-13-ene synthase [Dichanthelium oligosanthes]|uniref:Stemar-13-ene synthase n=1 Tax=Dichanthelium oligosanthes TaxID=888268 RepID=A0A1E5UVA3_9POAL|nr:Stemar-13-ene synthase [Dichanthelium oligosanthes]